MQDTNRPGCRKSPDTKSAPVAVSPHRESPASWGVGSRYLCFVRRFPVGGVWAGVADVRMAVGSTDPDCGQTQPLGPDITVQRRERCGFGPDSGPTVRRRPEVVMWCLWTVVYRTDRS